MLTALASITMEPLMFPVAGVAGRGPQFGVGGRALDHLRVGAGQRDDRGRGIYHVDGAGDLGGGVACSVAHVIGHGVAAGNRGVDRAGVDYDEPLMFPSQESLAVAPSSV